MSHGSRAMNLLVGCLLTAALPGIAFADPLLDAPPPPDAPAPADLAERLTLLNVQLADLTARRDAISLRGPVAFLIGGVVAAGVGLALATSSSCVQYENAADKDACLDDKEGAQVLGAVLFFAGTASAMAGTIITIVRASKRRHLNRKILQRQDEANALRGLQPQWGVAPTRGGGGVLSLSMAF